MQLTYGGIIEDIRRQNYVEVPLLAPRFALDNAGRAFLEFLALPQDIKSRFTVLADSRDRGSDSGYVHRDCAKGYDDKEFFNYRGITERLLTDTIWDYQENPAVMNFLRYAVGLYISTKETLKSVVRIIDERHSGIYKKVFETNPARFICLRFVAYHGTRPDGLLAKAHYDRGSCALAIAESAPGLRVGSGPNDLRDVVRHGHSALFMPAYTFAEDTGSQEFVPAWHDVVLKSGHTCSGNIARWAIVLFADVPAERLITLEDTHRPGIC